MLTAASVAPDYSGDVARTSRPRRNRIQEERRKTLGDVVLRGGTDGSLASPLLPAAARLNPLAALAGQNPASPAIASAGQR